MKRLTRFFSNNDDSFNALVKAIESGSLQGMRDVYAKGMDLSRKDYKDRTPFDLTMSVEFEAGALYLLKEGYASPKTERPDLFHRYYTTMSRDVMMAARRIGFDINYKGDNPYLPTALFSAAHYGSWDAVQNLVDAGADLFVRDNKGETAAVAARDAGRDRCAKYLETQERYFLAWAQAGWHLWSARDGRDEIARITCHEKMKYKLTEVFNFTEGLYRSIQQNLETNAESAAVLPIADLESGSLLHRAQQEFETRAKRPPANGNRLFKKRGLR